MLLSGVLGSSQTDRGILGLKPGTVIVTRCGDSIVGALGCGVVSEEVWSVKPVAVHLLWKMEPIHKQDNLRSKSL